MLHMEIDPTLMKGLMQDPDPELSYYTEDNEGQGCGGRGAGWGGGHGRGNQGGRGGGRGGNPGRGATPGASNGGQPTTVQGRVHFEQDSGNDDSLFLMDNLDQVEHYSHVSAHLDFAGYTHQDTSDTTILLDSCSTVNLIANKDLLDGIHKVPTTMRICCNAGVTSTNLQGWLGDFPEPVWYNPKGVANIMSLFVVKKYYRVQYDSAKQDAMIVVKPDGSDMVFTPTAKGLYALNNHLAGWAHVNTVAERKSEYTKREYRDAVLAWKIQNILMFPGVQAYTKIADSKLIANCPIGRADIAAAERIFGPNLGALKGKMVKRGSVPVNGCIEGVPPSILEQ